MKKIAVVIIDTEKDAHGEYIPCIVKENEKGYFLTSWSWGTDRTIAEKIAEQYNKNLGISKEEAMELVLKSMSPRHELGNTKPNDVLIIDEGHQTFKKHSDDTLQAEMQDIIMHSRKRQLFPGRN